MCTRHSEAGGHERWAAGARLTPDACQRPGLEGQALALRVLAARLFATPRERDQTTRRRCGNLVIACTHAHLPTHNSDMQPQIQQQDMQLEVFGSVPSKAHRH